MRARTITRLWILAALMLVIAAGALPAYAVAISYGPLAGLQDPADGGPPTSAVIYWRTDASTLVNKAYISSSPDGPWTLAGTDTAIGDRHQVTASGLSSETRYYAYVESDGVSSAPFEFRTGANLFVNGSFETWHTVTGQTWGVEEPDGWHGWEIFPWGGSYANPITIQMDRNTGVPNPFSRHLSHRASMDEGWRTCYGGLYQEVTGLAPGTYVVSGWAAWMFDGITNNAGHSLEILAKDGNHTAGVAPTGTVIWKQNAPTSDQKWKYVQGTVECTTGTITVYANLKADSPDGASFAHFDGMRLMQANPSVAGFSNFNSTYSLSGSTYNITITYETAIPTTTQIEWGTTTSYGNTTPLDPALVTHHVVQLTGVAPSTNPYHFRARATAGDVDEYSGDYTFEAPKIAFSGINAAVDADTGTICIITWNTNYATTTNRVYYRKVGDAAYSVAQAASDPQALKSHSVTLTGLQLDTQYEYRVQSAVSGIPLAVSTPDRVFRTPVQPGVSMFFGLSMVGGPILENGDDVSPGQDWENLMLYEHPWLNITTLGFASFAQCQPNDPGDGPDVYDWTAIDRAIAKAVPGKARLGYYQMWGTSPDWVELDTPRFWQKFEKFVEEQVVHINENFGEVDIVFENEPNISRAPEVWHWADWYIHCLQHFYTAVHRANARTGIYNKVIAGNLSGGAAGGFADLYARGLKNCSDVLGIHPYPDHIRDGVKVADLALMHSIMEQYGDGDKKIWVSEGWGSGRSAGFDRSSPLIEPTALEIENMWLAMAKGWDNLMTPRDHWHPSYLWGVSFFTANDNWGAQGWRERAIPQKDGAGNIVGFIVDGYWMTPDIAPYFWNGGMYDFYGNSKDALHLLFPGNGLVFMNPGFELKSEPPKAHTPHFWTTEQDPPSTANYALDDVIYRSGSRCLKLSQTTAGSSGVWQMTAKRSALPGVSYRARVWCKTEDVASVAGRFYMRFVSLDATTKSTQYWADTLTGNKDWTLLEVVATAPEYTGRIEVGCYMSGVGTVRFDDVTIAIASEQEVGMVKGYTLDELQVPVPYSIVSTTTGGCQTVSDENGYFELHDVPTGTYDFICRKPGYVPFRTKNQTVAAGKTSFVMFCMGIPKAGLAVTDVQADASTADPTKPVSVTVTVRNATEYPVNLSDVGLFIEHGDSDATGEFTIHADPYNPKVINAYTNEQFNFTVTPRQSALGLDVKINAYAFGQEDRPNMLQNGGFDSEPWNTHWSFNGGAQLTWEPDITDYYSPPRSLKCTISSNNFSWNWADNWSAWGVNAVPAKPHTNYTVGCYHKDNSTDSVSVCVFIQEYYYDGENWFYNGRRFIGMPKRSVWAHDCMIYETGSPQETPGLYPTNRLIASVGPCTNNQPANGVTWWDDLYLKETGDWLADDRADVGAPLVVATEVDTLAEAFALPAGTTVKISSSLVVTAGSESFADRVYAQTPDRAAGTLIKLADGEAAPAMDDAVTVIGTVGDVDGERALLDARLTPAAPLDAAKPLGVAGGALVGSDLTSGLLVRAWGRVTFVASDNSYFLIDDGSRIAHESGFNGVKVVCSDAVEQITPPTAGVFTSLTAISSREAVGAAVLRVRRQADLP